MPNTYAVSLDDRRSAFQLVQIIVRLRPTCAKSVLEGRGPGGLFAGETIRNGQELKTKGMPVWADSKWTLEKLQVVMQLVKGVSGFIYRVRTGGQIQFGVRENVTKRCEMHEREQTCPGTATVETWTFAIHNAASRHRRNAFGMESESWRPMVVIPKAPVPRQRSRNGHFWVLLLQRDLLL